MAEISSTDLTLILLALAALVGGSAWLSFRAGYARARTELADLRGALARELEQARAKILARDGVELEALMVRRWLRNALEDPTQSPAKAVVSGAAVLLALIGKDALATAIRPLAGADARKAQRVNPVHPDVQVAQQWDRVLAELAYVQTPDEETRREFFFDERDPKLGPYRAPHELERAAREVIINAHEGAKRIATERLGAHAAEVVDLPLTEPTTH